MLDEAVIVAEEVGANTVVDLALLYRANHLALHGRIDDVTATLEQVRPRLDGREFDQPA